MASIIISAVPLLVSLEVAWLTLFRRGKLCLTQPKLIGFLYDLPGQEPKVFFRAALYSTGKRGHIVEAIYVKVRRGESTQNFSFWMYGETEKLVIGSGLRVGEEGVSCNHHFVLPRGASLADPVHFLAHVMTYGTIEDLRGRGHRGSRGVQRSARTRSARRLRSAFLGVLESQMRPCAGTASAGASWGGTRPSGMRPAPDLLGRRSIASQACDGCGGWRE